MLNVHTTNQDAYITCNNALAQAKMLRPHVELLKPQVKNAQAIGQNVQTIR